MPRLTDSELDTYHGGRDAYIATVTKQRDAIVARLQADAYTDEPAIGPLPSQTAQEQRAHDLRVVATLNTCLIDNFS